MSTLERERLTAALRGHAEGRNVLLMDRHDTSFVGTTDEAPAEAVIDAVAAIPSHY